MQDNQPRADWRVVIAGRIGQDLVGAGIDMPMPHYPDREHASANSRMQAR
jgi:hypothetical protein